jgi:hypothetical protein
MGEGFDNCMTLDDHGLLYPHDSRLYAVCKIVFILTESRSAIIRSRSYAC